MPSMLSGSSPTPRRSIEQAIAWVMVLAGTGFSASAEQMATYQSGKEAAIILLDEACPGEANAGSKLAYQKKTESDLVAGCWSFNEKNQTVITWRGGRVQTLDSTKIQYEPKYARTTEPKRPDPAPQAKAPPRAVTPPRANPPTQAAVVPPAPKAPPKGMVTPPIEAQPPIAAAPQISAPPRVAAAPSVNTPPQVAIAPPPIAPPQVVVAPRHNLPPRVDGPYAVRAPATPPSPSPSPVRPAWCKDAKRAHELLICRDAELSANDLALIPYWRSYRSRMELSRAEETRVKNDFYGRQKRAAATARASAASRLRR